MYLGQAEAEAEDRSLNPTVWEVGFPPVRVTIPVTSKARQKEVWGVSAGMIAVSAGLLWLGGGYIKQVIQIWRG